MMKAVLSCDDVFDVLTRGPFPTGNSDDDFVDAHLKVCHECRQFAEALRPAVGLFHESMANQAESALPSYRGTLAEALRGEPALVKAVSLDSICTTKHEGRSKPGILTVAAGLLALLLLSVNAVVNQMRDGSSEKGSFATWNATDTAHKPRPALAAMGIPLSCVPAGIEPIELKSFRAANLNLTPSQREDFICCTRCHFSGGRSASQPAMQKLMIACAHCHSAANTDRSA